MRYTVTVSIYNSKLKMLQARMSEEPNEVRKQSYTVQCSYSVFSENNEVIVSKQDTLMRIKTIIDSVIRKAYSL